jgi:hypothetical protein
MPNRVLSAVVTSAASLKVSLNRAITIPKMIVARRRVARARMKL